MKNFIFLVGCFLLLFFAGIAPAWAQSADFPDVGTVGQQAFGVEEYWLDESTGDLYQLEGTQQQYTDVNGQPYVTYEYVNTNPTPTGTQSIEVGTVAFDPNNTDNFAPSVIEMSGSSPAYASGVPVRRVEVLSESAENEQNQATVISTYTYVNSETGDVVESVNGNYPLEFQSVTYSEEGIPIQSVTRDVTGSAVYSEELITDSQGNVMGIATRTGAGDPTFVGDGSGLGDATIYDADGNTIGDITYTHSWDGMTEEQRQRDLDRGIESEYLGRTMSIRNSETGRLSYQQIVNGDGIVMEETQYDSNGEAVRGMSAQFDEAGNFTGTLVQEWGENGLLQTTYDADGNLLQTVDANGRIIREGFEDENGEWVVAEHTYNQNTGERTNTNVYDASGNRINGGLDLSGQSTFSGNLNDGGPTSASGIANVTPDLRLPLGQSAYNFQSRGLPGDQTAEQLSQGLYKPVTDQLERAYDPSVRIVYVLAAIGCLGLGARAFFGKFNWQWFFTVIGALMVIALTHQTISFLLPDEDGNYAGLHEGVREVERNSGREVDLSGVSRGRNGTISYPYADNP